MRAATRSRPGIASLVVALSMTATAAGEEASRSVIRLEEITLVDFVQHPSLFIEVRGPDEIVAARACAGGPAKRSAACADYEAALDGWGEVSRRRQKIEALEREHIVAREGARGETRWTPSILDELVTETSFRGDLDDELAVVALGGAPTGALGEVHETLLQARGVLRRCAGQSPARSLSLLIELGADGRALPVDGEAGSCVGPALRALRFPGYSGGEIARYAVFYRPPQAVERAPSPPLDRARSRAPSADDRGDAPPGPFTIGIARQLIVDRSMGEIRACAWRALRDHLQGSGFVRVSFTVGGDGRVTSARAEESSLPAALDPCVLSALRALRFPPPEGGDVPLSFTFLFRR